MRIYLFLFSCFLLSFISCSKDVYENNKEFLAEELAYKLLVQKVSESELEAFIVQNSIQITNKDFEKIFNEALKKVSYSNIEIINTKYSKTDSYLETRGIPCYQAYEKDIASAIWAGNACMTGVVGAALLSGGSSLAGTIACTAVIAGGILVAEVAYSSCMKHNYE